MTYSTTNTQAPALKWNDPEEARAGQLEVNVIFTDSEATAMALKAATKLAADLQACIRLRAAIAVPLRLPVDHPQVSVPFTENILSELVSGVADEGVDVTANLYLCRDEIEIFSQILCPNSLVVIAGRKRLWPTAESRIAKRLQAEGHRVVFIPVGGKNRASLEG